ncbi:MAG: ParB/RepB/Spo0J family partition protein [Endomicrobiia bacterium]|nr:ParB/RepB/Spo0J family partition protein [Endomicrobiia bacterium]
MSPTRGGEANIAVDKIRPNPKQPRKNFNETKLRELASSIKNHGLAQPILVSPSAVPGEYEIVAGERRWRAAKIAGLKEVPAVVRDTDDKNKFQLSLVENLQREDLNPIEEAFAYKTLMKDFDHTQEEIAGALGKDRSVIANAVRLLSLPEEIQTLIEDGTISAGHGRSLAAVRETHKQKEILKKILDGNLNVREVEIIVREIKKNSGGGGGARKPKRSAELLNLENTLEQIYGTKVRIQGNSKKGKITIHYYSLEDLERMSRMLKKAGAK